MSDVSESESSRWDDVVHSLSSIGTGSTKGTVGNNGEDRLTNMMIMLRAAGRGAPETDGSATPRQQQVPLSHPATTYFPGMIGQRASAMRTAANGSPNLDNSTNVNAFGNNRIALFQGIPRSMHVGPLDEGIASHTDMTDVTDQISDARERDGETKLQELDPVNQHDSGGDVDATESHERTAHPPDSTHDTNGGSDDCHGDDDDDDDDIEDYGTCEDISLTSERDVLTGWKDGHPVANPTAANGSIHANRDHRNVEIDGAFALFAPIPNITRSHSARRNISIASTTNYSFVTAEQDSDSGEEEEDDEAPPISLDRTIEEPEQEEHHHVQFLYENAKGAWIWSKQLAVVGGAFGIAEDVAQAALNAVGTSLQDIDERVVQPHVVRPLDDVATPVVDGMARTLLETTDHLVPDFVRNILNGIWESMHRKRILDHDKDSYRHVLLRQCSSISINSGDWNKRACVNA